MLEIHNLACMRGDRLLFKQLHFRLDRGELLLVSGHNGSGKTSLLRMVCGLLAPAHGEIRWQGEPIQKQRDVFHAELTHIGHSPAVKEELTAVENLVFTCRFAGGDLGREQAEEALGHMGLSRCLHLPVKSLSQGQRRRAALARLLVSNSSLWVLDEPLVALDHAAFRYVQSIFKDHVERGGMVMLTTHQPLTLEGLAQRELKLTD
ncbi:MAG: cytochrome c biogenesis heme-transporting ATPase CcmA [Ectothiorhodospiraceae bacterium]|jgi:heme exporter protein A|nr:cytochrome c biogenesis heme-transporting ATPase CcmA [Ectothiorhodospiraceae bacterium]